MVHLRIQHVGLEHVLFPVLSQKKKLYLSLSIVATFMHRILVLDMVVSKNRGNPKSSILIGVFIIFTIHFGVLYPYFLGWHPYRWKPPIFTLLGLSLGSFAEVKSRSRTEKWMIPTDSWLKCQTRWVLKCISLLNMASFWVSMLVFRGLTCLLACFCCMFGFDVQETEHSGDLLGGSSQLECKWLGSPHL